jgi:hypothetical protein
MVREHRKSLHIKTKIEQYMYPHKFCRKEICCMSFSILYEDWLTYIYSVCMITTELRSKIAVYRYNPTAIRAYDYSHKKWFMNAREESKASAQRALSRACNHILSTLIFSFSLNSCIPLIKWNTHIYSWRNLSATYLHLSCISIFYSINFQHDLILISLLRNV